MVIVGFAHKRFRGRDKAMSVGRMIKGAMFPFYKWIYDAVLGNKRSKYLYYRLAVFLSTRGIAPPLAPSASSVKDRWRRQGQDGAFDNPATYATEDRTVPELFRDVLPHLHKDSRILEIGCNAGRSLNYLYENGFRNLTGIEIGAEAVELMKKVFPDAYKSSRLIIGDAPDELKRFKDNEFDLVFCHSVLVNIHPRYNRIFTDMARISRRFVLTLESEGSYTAYPRDFKRMFEKEGLKMVAFRVFAGSDATIPAPFEDRHIYANNTIRLFVKDKSSF